MNYSLLKKFRVILSLVFFVFIGFFFLDLFNTFPSDWINTVLYLQFAPSVIQFFHGATIAAAGFIFILILTLLFGRLYCSTLCPLGTFQDIFSWIGGRVKKRNNIVRVVIRNVVAGCLHGSIQYFRPDCRKSFQATISRLQ